MKKIILILVLILSISLVVSCSNEATEENPNEGDISATEIRVASLKGPTTMGLSKLIEDKQESDLYKFDIYGTPDQIVSQIVNGEIDMAVIPCNLASVLYNQTDGAIKVGAINNLGVLYVLESGSSVETINDLVGKKLYSVGKNTTPEYVLNYLLKENNINKDTDLTIEYKSEATELAAALNEQPNQLALLPQPYVTIVQMQNEEIKIALDLNEEWKKVNDSSNIVTGVLVARNQFIEENKAEFDNFLSEYKNSIEYVNNNPKEAAKLIKKFGIVDNEIVAEKAIPKSSITYIDGEEMKTMISGYLEVLYSANPQSVGGEMPEDDFYYQK